jgi:hypothetical protein
MKNKTIQYNFFIGQNNTTKKAEFKKAERVFLRHKVKGFSVIKNIKGYWESETEKSFKVEVIANEFNPFNDTKAKSIKAELENELKQFLVLTTKQEINILS